MPIFEKEWVVWLSPKSSQGHLESSFLEKDEESWKVQRGTFQLPSFKFNTINLKHGMAICVRNCIQDVQHHQTR